MNVETADAAVARIASAIGEPARTRMLFCLLDGRARTSTELAVIAAVAPPTASAHLNRLKAENLVTVQAQGKHRYYVLKSAQVARALEGMSVLAGAPRASFQPTTPAPYRLARSCYDHMAGRIAVQLLDRFRSLRWFRASSAGPNTLELMQEGQAGLAALGVDLDAAHSARRRFAYGCLDWSERRMHLAGALGSELMKALLARQWVESELDSRALRITPRGRREFRQRLQLEI
ncbi:MAG TPA: helix-turn-helix transcriptional regulator [Terracidiphilus sp.]|jgi:DNA-binding transcriptional ArsR family regulator|nr:helix-turn-helix transcriptional regulator [Terracidiphilus sp.]